MVGGMAGLREVLYMSEQYISVCFNTQKNHSGLLKAIPQKLGYERIHSCLHISLYAWI